MLSLMTDAASKLGWFGNMFHSTWRIALLLQIIFQIGSIHSVSGKWRTTSSPNASLTIHSQG